LTSILIDMINVKAMSWLTSEEALSALGTKPQSLYASVSRGRIRVRPDPNDPRRNLYAGDDIERLARRAAGRRKSTVVAADAIRWGDPVLPSAITTVRDGRLYYRGRDVLALADTASLEDTAALLWQVPRVELSPSGPIASEQKPSLAAALSALAVRTADDAPTLGPAPQLLRRDAAEILSLLATALGGQATGPAHRRLAAGWRRPEAAGLLRRALVLLADHELNASAFAVRVAVSTGASLTAATLAGLATLTGPLHGGAAAAVGALATELQQRGPAVAAKTWTGRERLPGFGHPLYPDGDPRAEALLDGFPLPPVYGELARIGRDMTAEAPNVDFALAAFAAAFALPAGAPLELFALARSVGWLAHALEQIETGALIRPRATYTGPEPEPTPLP